MAAGLAPNPCPVEPETSPVTLAAFYSLSRLRATAHDVRATGPMMQPVPPLIFTIWAQRGSLHYGLCSREMSVETSQRPAGTLA